MLHDFILDLAFPGCQGPSKVATPNISSYISGFGILDLGFLDLGVEDPRGEGAGGPLNF